MVGSVGNINYILLSVLNFEPQRGRVVVVGSVGNINYILLSVLNFELQRGG